MIETEQVVLHLGLHKTATGTLQRQFFPACTDLNLLTTKAPQMRDFVTYVNKTDPLYFDSAHARMLIEDVLSQDKPNLLSNESFSGPPYAGVIEAGLDHRTPVLQNLQAVFPHAKAILVLRRQDGLARSLYRQYLKSGGTRSVRRFYGLGNSEYPPLLSLNRFLFTPYVEAVQATFPSGFLLLTFEEFAANQESFLQQLIEFIEISLPDIHLARENATSLGPIGMETTRILNHFFRSLLNPAGMIPGYRLSQSGEKRRISPVQFLHDKWPSRLGGVKSGEIGTVAKEILELSRDDNRQLDEKFHLNLAQYNYY